MREPAIARSESAPAVAPVRILLGILFAVYLVLLTWLVIWKLEVPSLETGGLRVLKLVPFVASGGYAASAPLEVIGNIVVFVPFGCYLGLLASALPWWRAAGVIAVASLLMETVQYVLAVGRADVTDIVANTVGGVIGLALGVPVRLLLRGRPPVGVACIALVATVIAVLAVTVFVIELS